MWVIFSISAAFIWAIVNTIDKYVLSKWVEKPVIPLVTGVIIGLISGLFVYLIAVILTIFYPEILKKEIGKPSLFLKLIGIILIFVGAVLII